jgi:hypothetical protein
MAIYTIEAILTDETFFTVPKCNLKSIGGDVEHCLSMVSYSYDCP